MNFCVERPRPRVTDAFLSPYRYSTTAAGSYIKMSDRLELISEFVTKREHFSRETYMKILAVLTKHASEPWVQEATSSLAASQIVAPAQQAPPKPALPVSTFDDDDSDEDDNGRRYTMKG